MNLNDLLHGEYFDPKQVLVLRHRPQESKTEQMASTGCGLQKNRTCSMHTSRRRTRDYKKSCKV